MMLIRRIAAALLLALAYPAAPTQAIDYIKEPPIRPQIDENGVNVATGGLYLAGTQASIGLGSRHGLSFLPIWVGDGWRHDYVIAVSWINAGPAGYRVNIGGETKTFTRSGSTYTSDQGDGSTLQDVGGTNPFLYTAHDGTKISFRQLGDTPYFGSSLRSWEAVSVTYPDGEVLTLTYVAQGYSKLSSVTSNLGYQISYSYGPTTNDPWRINNVTFVNNVDEYCDPAASPCSVSSSWPRMQYSYFAVGSTIQAYEQDPAGNSTRYTTNSSRQLIGIKRPMSSTDDVTISYDGNGRVQTVVRDGATYTYSWSDAAGVRTMSMTGPLSVNRTVKSDIATGFVRQDTNALSQTTYYDYDSFGRITRVTQPKGNYADYSYDGRGNLLSTTWVSKTPGTPANVVVSATFDATCANPLTCNQPNTTTDAASNVTSYTYDGTHGGVLTETSPAVSVGGSMIQPQKRYGYTPISAWFKNSSGVLTSASAVYVQTSQSECQTTASCVGTSDEAVSSITYQSGSVSAGSNVLPIANAAGSATAPTMTSSSYAYDSISNRITVTDALGADTHIFYDADRRVTGRIGPDPDGGGSMKRRATRYTFNANGLNTRIDQGTANGTSSSDLSGMAVLQYQATDYDAATRPITQSQFPAGGSQLTLTQTSYDTIGRVDCVAQRMDAATFGSQPDACTQTTPGATVPDRIERYSYDTVSRVLKIQSGYGVPGTVRDTRTSTYTTNGKLLTLADAGNNLTTYQYDGLDRLQRTSFPSKTTPGTSSSTDYEELTYDSGSRVSAKRLRDGHGVGFGYDALNRLTGRTYSPGNNNANVSFAYDLLSRRTGAARGNGAYGTNATFAYDALDRVTSQTSYYGATATNPKTLSYCYDAAGRRTLVNWNDGLSIAYTYLATGEMLALYEGGTTCPAGGTSWVASFGYDDLGNRTYLTRANGVVTYYHYDGISRIDTLTQDFPDAGSDQALGFGYNPASQIVSRSSSNDRYAWTQGYNVSRTYTPNGLNQYTTIGSTPVTYDDGGNLTNKGNATYSYDDDNQLTGKDGQRFDYDALGRLTYSTQTNQRFGYDDDALVAEYDGSGNVLRRYVHGPDVDEPLLWYEGGGTSDRRFLHADERGSIIAVSNNAGGSIVTNAYSNWGIPQFTNLGRFGYTGQIWMPELGLWYYKARMYSSATGRFLQTDPIGYNDGLNWYNYVGGDPVNNVDPTGLEDLAITVSCDWACQQRILGFQRIEAFERRLDAGRILNGPSAGGGERGGGKGDGQPDDGPEIVVTARKKVAQALDYFADNYLKPPAGRQDGESLSDCVQRIAGDAGLAASGATAAASGANIVPYPRAVPPGGSGTSIISTISRGLFSGLPRMSFRIFGTTSIGGAIGRILSRASVLGGAAAMGAYGGKVAGAAQVCSR